MTGAENENENYGKTVMIQDSGVSISLQLLIDIQLYKRQRLFQEMNFS